MVLIAEGDIRGLQLTSFFDKHLPRAIDQNFRNLMVAHQALNGAVTMGFIQDLLNERFDLLEERFLIQVREARAARHDLVDQSAEFAA